MEATRETTQEFLQRLKDYALNCTQEELKEWGKTREELQAEYDIAKDISETLDIWEIRLLFLLRIMPCGEAHRFLRSAVHLAEAYRERNNLQELEENFVKFDGVTNIDALSLFCFRS